MLAEALQTVQGREARAPSEQEAALKHGMAQMRVSDRVANGPGHARETVCKTESALMDGGEEA